MNVFFLADNYPPERNAAAARVHERARWWVRDGHRVQVITGAPNFPEGRVFPGYSNRWLQQEVMEGVEVVRVKTYIAANRGTWLRTLDFLSFMVMAVWAALWQARHGRPDLVVATSPQFFAAVGGWLASVLLRRPFVMEVSDLWPASIVAVGALRDGFAIRVLERLELFLYSQAAQVVVQTPAFERDLLRRGVPPAKISVVLNGVELSQFGPRDRDHAKRRELGLPEEGFVVGYLGTLGMAHGLGNVLDAAARLDGGAATFLLMGPGAEREKLAQEIAARRLSNVVLAPAQEKSEMPRAWSACDVALVHLKDSPVFATVIPSKIFEAMAMGLPVLLAAPAGEASALVERENCGWHVPAGQPGALAEAVERLRTEPESRAALARRGAQAASRYGREKQAHDMMAAFERALAAAALPAQPRPFWEKP